MPAKSSLANLAPSETREATLLFFADVVRMWYYYPSKTAQHESNPIRSDCPHFRNVPSCGPSIAHAQLEVETGLTLEEYVNDILLGNGIQALNITYQGGE